MAVHHAVSISCQRNSGYRRSRINITAQGLSTPDPSLQLHTSIRRVRTTATHYTHYQVSLMVSRNTTLVPSPGLHIGPACKAGLSAGMRMEGVSPQIRKKERQDFQNIVGILLLCVCGVDQVHCMLAMRYVKLMETVSLVRRLKLYSGHWSVTAHSLYSLNVTIVLFQAIINGQASLHEIVRIFCIRWILRWQKLFLPGYFLLL